jgi:hypothetical protein
MCGPVASLVTALHMGILECGEISPLLGARSAGVGDELMRAENDIHTCSRYHYSVSLFC